MPPIGPDDLPPDIDARERRSAKGWIVAVMLAVVVLVSAVVYLVAPI